MESQQIVDYISEQLAAGHSEASLRQHLTAHGWSPAAIADAFIQYRKITPEQPTTKKHKHKKERQHRVRAGKWTSKRKLRAAVTILAVSAVVLFIRLLVVQNTTPSTPPKLKPLSHTAMQSLDIDTVGGAVGLYAQENADLPVATSVAPDGNAVLCGTSCDPTTSEVGTLRAYKATNVKITPYAAGLIAPDDQTMYLVPAAKCANSSTLGGQSTAPRSMVILYADINGTTLRQHCATL